MKPTAVKKITAMFTAALILFTSVSGLFPAAVSAEGTTSADSSTTAGAATTSTAASTTAATDTTGTAATTGTSATTASANADTAATTEADSATEEVTDNSYTGYISRYSTVPDAENAISLSLDSAVLTDGSTIQTEQNRTGLVLPVNGTASWTIQVPKTALYVVKFDYCTMAGYEQNIQFGMKIDGDIPFDGASSFELNRFWVDKGGMRDDGNGNQLAPLQQEVFEWKTAYLEDYADYYNGQYSFYLTEGQHTIALNGVKETFALANISLEGKEKIPSYADVAATYAQKGYKTVGSDISIKTQAENTYEKSSSALVPDYDRTSAVTESYDGSLNDPSKIRRDVSWYGDLGDWTSYTVDVPEDGLYKLSLKIRQSETIGMSVIRDIYVDGKIPFAEMQGVTFPYTSKFETKTISDSAGNPCLIYLTKGQHEIRFVTTIDKWSDVLNQINDVNMQLNQLYRKITTITGSTPDSNRDYNLDTAIPDMVDIMNRSAESLFSLADQFDKLNSNDSSQSSVLRTNARQLQSFVKDPSTVASRLSNYQSNIAALSDWLLGVKDQPLETDYFILSGADYKLPRATPTLVQSLQFGFGAFVSTFTEDYNYSMSSQNVTKDSITVWYAGSRDTAQIIRDMIDDEFTSKYHISINLSLVYQGYIEATLAGNGPDVALEVNRGMPVNLASRGALYDLSKFSTYSDVMKRFSKDAAVPYTYNGGVYALPLTQIYYMMFYRTDILKELGIDPPNTWDDVYKDLPILERNNYNFGLPYTTISAQGTESIGLGVKDAFTTLLLQSGGQLYTDDRSRSALDSNEAINTFKMWTELYSKYGLPTQYDANTRLRTGSVPVMLGTYNLFNTFVVGAPEIRGLWNMTVVPGTVKEDGTVDRSVGASGTATVMFKNAKNPDACWQFMDWWTSDDVQYEYGIKIENRLGQAGRSQTANINAFDRLPWSQDQLAKLEEQRKSVVEIPEVPGTYVVSRSLDNAFRSVVFSGKSERETFLQEVDTINEEIQRKRVEFGLE